MSFAVLFEIEGVARIQGKRLDGLEEHTQFVDWIWHKK